MRRRWQARAVVALLGFGAVLRHGDGAAAQEVTLAAVQSAVDAGRVAEARAALETWFVERAGAAERTEMAHARFLRARLTEDADSAEVEYLWVAIDGGAPWGAWAWLRLAQLHLARGDAERAEEELSRLRAEYPESLLGAESWWWTGAAREAKGELPSACEAWRRAEREAERSGQPDVRERARSARAVCSSRSLQLTVQLGAFQSRDGAETLRERADKEGFAVRVERPDGELWRVRVGRFASVESARAMVDRLRARGFSAVILSSGT